jgi:cell division septal protein FtsQ
MLPRKKQNRRFHREHILEVRMHSKHVREARMRWAMRTVSWVVGLVGLGIALWKGTQWSLDEFVYRNPTFAVRLIDLETDGVLPRDQLRLWTGIKMGDNLFALDLQRVRRDLELNSLIRQASVERILPGTLWVRVSEREPVAQFVVWQINPNGEGMMPVTFYVDGEGHLIKPAELPRTNPSLLEEFQNLPRLVGVAKEEIVFDKPVDTARLQAAIQFLRAFRQASISDQLDVLEIHVDVRNVLEVTTSLNSRIRFGYHDHALQLQRWRLVEDYARQAARAVQTLDLSVTNNVPARWQDISAVPPVPPTKPTKPTNPRSQRKKNV